VIVREIQQNIIDWYADELKNSPLDRLNGL